MQKLTVKRSLTSILTLDSESSVWNLPSLSSYQTNNLERIV